MRFLSKRPEGFNHHGTCLTPFHPNGEPWVVRREKALRIFMRVGKGDWNRAVSRNNRKNVGPVSVLWRTRNVYTALGARPYVQLFLQSACSDMFRHRYNWNIVAFDFKHLISLTHSHSFEETVYWSSIWHSILQIINVSSLRDGLVWFVCYLMSHSTTFQSYVWRQIDDQAVWRRRLTYHRATTSYTFRRVLLRAH